MKCLLTNALILKITYLDKEFLICTNACEKLPGGLLMRERSVVCYESMKLNEHDQKYVTHDLEFLAIIHALKMWRHYLLGRRFVLINDHGGMSYLFYQPNLNSRQAKWFYTLSEFDFEIRYIKGKENRVVDALSTRVHLNHISTLSSYRTYL